MPFFRSPGMFQGDRRPSARTGDDWLGAAPLGLFQRQNQRNKYVRRFPKTNRTNSPSAKHGANLQKAHFSMWFYLVSQGLRPIDTFSLEPAGNGFDAHGMSNVPKQRSEVGEEQLKHGTANARRMRPTILSPLGWGMAALSVAPDTW